MRHQPITFSINPDRQKGVSILVALIMLLVLTLIGVSSMKTAIVELRMAGSMQQQGIALNRAEELLQVSEADIDAIVADPDAYDFSLPGDGYYVNADAVDVHQIDWVAQGLTATPGTHTNDFYVTEYLGRRAVPGGTEKEGEDGGITGGFVYTFRLTTRSATGKNAVRLVQSIYVADKAP
jgi:Tfp pilus assembly protein PilX